MRLIDIMRNHTLFDNCFQLLLTALLLATTAGLTGCASTDENYPRSMPAGWVTVSRVIDGDTFVTQDGICVDVKGIDTPNLKSQDTAEEPGAQEAKLLARSHIQEGYTVWLDQHQMNETRRCEANVRLMGGTDYAEIVRKHGLDKIALNNPSESAPAYMAVEAPPWEVENDPYFVHLSGFMRKDGTYSHPKWVTRLTSRASLDRFNAIRNSPKNSPWPGFNYVPRKPVPFARPKPTPQYYVPMPMPFHAAPTEQDISDYAYPEPRLKAYWRTANGHLANTPIGYVHERNVSENMRMRVLTRDDYKCVVCGITFGLEVDHSVALENGGDNSFENLATICSTCHKAKTQMDNSLRRHREKISFH